MRNKRPNCAAAGRTNLKQVREAEGGAGGPDAGLDVTVTDWDEGNMTGDG